MKLRVGLFLSLMLFLLLTSNASARLNSARTNYQTDSYFSFVTFEKPTRLNQNNTNYSIDYDLVFNTFEKPNRVYSSVFLHTTATSFLAPMNFTNRTDVALELISPEEIFDGVEFNITLLISNLGNQPIENISLNYLNYTIFSNLPSKSKINFTFSKLIYNSTTVYANLSIRKNETNYTNNFVNKTIFSKNPISINSFYFSKETYFENETNWINLNVTANINANSTIYLADLLIKINFTKNTTYFFSAPFVVHNGSKINTTIIVDKNILTYSKIVEQGNLPDLYGQIFGDDLIIYTPIAVSNFTIHVIERDEFEILKTQEYFIDSIYKNKTIDLWNATRGNKIVAYLDYYNNVSETNKENNVVEGASGRKIYVSLGPDIFYRDAILNYTYANLKEYSFVLYPSEADVILSIGKTSDFYLFNPSTLAQGWGAYSTAIKYYNRSGTKPYNALLNYYFANNKKYVFVEGNSISGNLAALKRFVKGETRSFVGDDDIDGVKIYDYFLLFNSISEKEVSIALNNQMVTTEQINTTSTSGIPLRLLHIKPYHSNKFVNYVDSNGLPVVLAQGLWSNLYSWQSFGVELADSGKNVYLIEITGGPGQDCDDCVNYNFTDLTDDYWPALINKVRSDSGKDKIKYVGFSNGCRTALSALEKKTVDPTKIETFVGVGCPGAFEGIDMSKWFINPIDEKATNNLISNGKNHVAMSELLIAGLMKRSITSNKNKISLNLWRDYDTWMFSSLDLQPGKFSNDNFFIIQGTAFITNDLIVTVEDEQRIYDSMNVSVKKGYFSLFDTHIGLPDNKKTKSLIKNMLNNYNYTWWQANAELKEIQVKS